MAYNNSSKALEKVKIYLDRVISLKPGEEISFKTDPAHTALLAFNLRQGLAYCKKAEVAPYSYLQVRISFDVKTGVIKISKRDSYEVTVLDEVMASVFKEAHNLNDLIIIFYQNPGLLLYEFPNLESSSDLNEDLTNFAEANGYRWISTSKQMEKK